MVHEEASQAGVHEALDVATVPTARHEAGYGDSDSQEKQKGNCEKQKTGVKCH